MAYIYSPWKKIETKSGSSNPHENYAYGHVCEITLDAGTATTVDINTPAFDFSINSDFTVIVNSDATDFDNAPALQNMAIQGSATGSAGWADMSTLATASIDATSVHFIHDITTHGVMPFMKFHADGFSADPVTGGTKSLKIMVIPHVT